MKKILIILISFYLINNFALAAGGDSGGSSSKISMYDEAVKLIKRAGKLEKKDNPDKAVKLYKQAFGKLEKANKKDKDNPDILNYMGYTSRKSGNFDEAEKFYLKGLSLDIKAGEQIALVGSSGSGKSTIASLLLQFYKLDAGSITFDGKNATEYSINELRSQMAFVPQEVILLGGSIEENIRYGKLNASYNEVVAAAHIENYAQKLFLWADKEDRDAR